MSESQLEGVLPYSPLYPGFVLNTVFYAAVLWAISLGRAALLRTLRRRANRCPNCGYNLKGLPADTSPKCPECGHTNTITAA